MYQHKGNLCLSITRSNNRYVYALQGVGVDVRNLWLETAKWGSCGREGQIRLSPHGVKGKMLDTAFYIIYKDINALLGGGWSFPIGCVIELLSSNQ